MALNKIKTRPAGTYDLSAIGGMLTEQNEKVRQRQQVEIQTAQERQQTVARARKDALAINDAAREDAAAIRDQQLDILGGVNSQLDKARAAMALSDSDNPLDRVSLWFLQQQDPAYTREGNLARISYLQSASGALGDIDVIQQAGYADQIARTQELLDIQMAEQDDRLALVKLNEAQGQELIDAEIAAQNTRMGVIQHQNNMQIQALSNMTDDQVMLTTRQAAASPTKSANVGGVEIPLARLEARAREVEQLRYNEAVIRSSSADMILANLTMPELQELEKTALADKGRTADVNGTSIPLGRISDRIYTLNNQELGQVQAQYGLMQTQEAIIQKGQQNALDAMLLPQLESIIQNGFTDPVSGIKYDSTMVRNARDLKYDDTLKVASNEALVQSMQNPVSMATQTQQQIDAVIPNLPPNSPAVTALQYSKQGLALAANMIASGDPAKIETGMRLVASAQENLNAQLDSEAKRLAAGDKEKETAYQFSLRGQQIPPELIKSTLMERVKKGEYVGDWLTSEQNALFVSVYNTEKQRIQQESLTSAFQMSTEDVEAQAASSAVNAVMNQIAAPISDALLVMQANRTLAPTNPVTGVMTQTEFTAMLKNSDSLGMENFISGAGYDDEQANLIRTGQLIPPGLQEAQNAQLYMNLERRKPGLGDAYASWWAGADAGNLVDSYLQSALQSAGNDFTKMSQLSLVMPSAKDGMAAYGAAFEAGIQTVYSDQIAKEHAEYITFGNNPQTKQVFLLEQTPGLTSQEKQIAMQQIIQPILDITKASGTTDPAQVTLAVESTLRTFEPQTPQARAVLGKMLKGRDAALKVIDDFIMAGTGATGWMLAGANPGAVERKMENAMGVNSFEWFKQLQLSGVQQTQTPLNRGMQ